MFTLLTLFIDECCQKGVLWLHILNWLQLITLYSRIYYISAFTYLHTIQSIYG